MRCEWLENRFRDDLTCTWVVEQQAEGFITYLVQIQQ